MENYINGIEEQIKELLGVGTLASKKAIASLLDAVTALDVTAGQVLRGRYQQGKVGQITASFGTTPPSRKSPKKKEVKKDVVETSKEPVRGKETTTEESPLILKFKTDSVEELEMLYDADELKGIAENLGVSLGRATKKETIISKIKKHLA